MLLYGLCEDFSDLISPEKGKLSKDESDELTLEECIFLNIGFAYLPFSIAEF
jgi:hypothetical protein